MNIITFEDFYIDAGKELSPQDILTFIRAKQCQRPYLTELEKYYLGNQNILLKPTADASLPTNRIVTNFCAVIVDFYNTYLLGRPIQYKSSNEPLLKMVTDIMDYNDAHETDMENNQNANIFGVGAEQLYIDRSGAIRFKTVDYRDTIFVYTRDIERSLHSVIKYYKYNSTDTKYACEVWTKDKFYTYEVNESFSSVRKLTEGGHSFGDVPFVEYPNNNAKLSSFSKILTLQDAYNTLTSSEVDDYEAFVDSFLAIYNASGTDQDDIDAMKTNRVLLLDGESRAEWLVKKSEPSQIQQIKRDIISDIHKVASLPDLSDQNFASNASGVAIKYKMVGAENVASKQERKFKKGLQRRLELIVNFINLIESTTYDYRDIEITFNRNMIGADLEIAQLIALVGERIPIQNLATQLSFITESDIGLIEARDRQVQGELNAPQTTAKDGLK
jgi:SPP1 family phage portal protein